jgi:protein ImuB
MSCQRALVVWCPDWPVIAAHLIEGVSPHEPVAVFHANHVLACSPAARAEGVARGLRKRDAQGRCPRLVVVDHDPGRDASAYEPVLSALDEMVAGIEVLRPGVCAAATQGPTRYFGGEAALAEGLVERVAQRCGVEAQVGVADGVFAAGLAARWGRLVPRGETPGFLAEFDVAVLGRPPLADLLHRLGVRTLGQFASLPAAEVLARFGFDAALAHRLAGGRDDRPLAPTVRPPDLTVSETYDEPIARVDAAAFAARALAERLRTTLARHGLAGTRLVIEASTETGEELGRTWRHDGPLTAAGVSDRVRWQLESWLTGGGGRGGRGTGRGSPAPPASGITRLRLTPEGVVTHLGLQQGLWGDPGEELERAHRALTRVQGLLGPEGVVTAVRSGGRGLTDQVRLVPFAEEPIPPYPPWQPWPGRLPAPSPATVYVDPVPAKVCSPGGETVGVTGRLAPTAVPATVTAEGLPPAAVAGWAGPWPVDERWWSPETARRYARFQMVLSDGRALLLTLTEGKWEVAARYD